jgi:validoxylamine A glucosyltransferase
MPSGRAQDPRIAVVVPTYNRAELLRGTLRALATQELPKEQYEVVVSDDGSSDGTAQVVADFAELLQIGYTRQDDEGFRAGAARNAGARLARAPVLVFTDTGLLPGPHYLSAHLAAHEGVPADPGAAVIGYTYGYQPGREVPGLAELVGRLSPEEIVRHYGSHPDGWDIRHLGFAKLRFDLGRSPAPWQLFWSLNCSVSAAAFGAVGGFDEAFRTWGSEDLELGYRLFRRGARFTLNREAWAVDSPHPRSADSTGTANVANVLTFLHKHPDPAVELLWAWFARDEPWYRGGHRWQVDDELVALRHAAEAARGTGVRHELAALSDLPEGTRVIVLGCGADVPRTQPGTVLVDFDEHVVASLREACPDRVVHHLMGLRTPLSDGDFDLVFVSSRMRDLWDRWRTEILSEAHRIGIRVDGPLVREERLGNG